MTDSGPQGGTADEPLVNAGSGAVVAFTLAVVVLLGNDLMAQATQSLFGLFLTGAYDKATILVTWVFGALVPALASMGLAARASSDPAGARWERTVARSWRAATRP